MDAKRIIEEAAGNSAPVRRYAVADAFEKAAKAVKKALRGDTESVIQEAGGKFEGDGVKASLIERTSSLPDEDGLKALLKAKGLDIDAAFDEVIIFKVNPSKVQRLIDLGHLDAAEVEGLHKRSTAIKVKLLEE